MLPTVLLAQASPYVPNLDPVYQDLDALVAEGIVRDIILGERPYSRVAFARFAQEARRRIDTVGEAGIKPRFLEALERIERRFHRELAVLADVTATYPEVNPRVRIREASVDATAADSPARAMPTRLNLPADWIDGDLNPLLQNNQGRVLGDSWAFGVEGLLELQLGSRLAVQARPRIWTDSGRGRQNARTDATLLEAYARTLVGPVSLELGRNHVALGHGPEGGPILSHNARGLDMVRLSFDRPLRLPGPLGGLGLWHVSSLIADMGSNREYSPQQTHREPTGLAPKCAPGVWRHYPQPPRWRGWARGKEVFTPAQRCVSLFSRQSSPHFRSGFRRGCSTHHPLHSIRALS